MNGLFVTGTAATGRPTWIDSHCHLRDDVDGVVVEARRAGVTGLIDVGTTVEDSRAALDRARTRSGVWATAGVHPHDASGGIEGLRELARDPGIVAVGECGLDYHYLHSPQAEQRSVFAQQIAIARDVGKPVIIHTREAWADTFDIAVAESLPPGSVFHCFTGGPDEARRCLDLGALVSFSGIVTFRSADDVRAAATMCPLDAMLVETDAPFLAPVPHRGAPNRPALVVVVGEYIAHLRGLAPEEVALETSRNAVRTFGLPAGPGAADPSPRVDPARPEGPGRMGP